MATNTTTTTTNAAASTTNNNRAKSMMDRLKANSSWMSSMMDTIRDPASSSSVSFSTRLLTEQPSPKATAPSTPLRNSAKSIPTTTTTTTTSTEQPLGNLNAELLKHSNGSNTTVTTTVASKVSVPSAVINVASVPVPSQTTPSSESGVTLDLHGNLTLDNSNRAQLRQLLTDMKLKRQSNKPSTNTPSTSTTTTTTVVTNNNNNTKNNNNNTTATKEIVVKKEVQPNKRSKSSDGSKKDIVTKIVDKEEEESTTTTTTTTINGNNKRIVVKKEQVDSDDEDEEEDEYENGLDQHDDDDEEDEDDEDDEDYEDDEDEEEEDDEEEEEEEEEDEEEEGSEKNKINGDDIQFSTFDFTTGKPLPSYLTQLRTKHKMSKEELLKRAQLREKIIKRAKETGEGLEIAQTLKWASALDKAKGVKIKDNVKMIKKSIKRDQSKKFKSAREWNQRKRDAESTKSGKIKKREDNINAKIQRKKDKRMGIKPPKPKKNNNAKDKKDKKGGPGGGDKSSSGGSGDQKKRAGFEGQLEGRTVSSNCLTPFNRFIVNI
ncbi:hypothetical protein DFA_11973 [Cavenderia fasciculata]|uniref:Ribosomal RNA-processing protein 14/surfeit locus protein 6 C-terminal domain-containing protein n=1 Tax=Cavenderia fasciculata TaxID=261658 RepID=F4QF50_CACFS|nr:uncharacterized protein DFA_11973 [Cavenderia fasciculata]EGG14204.1 hypothetical protein DFA_11973 [Cavenderia fasciculata]|eukprot:XP_004350912.1 hypothetical protein DFA_11973 [Cavenderia fasciculata]